MFNFKQEVSVELSNETTAFGTVHMDELVVTWLMSDGVKVRLDGGLYDAPESQEYAYSLPIKMTVAKDGTIETFSLKTGFNTFHSSEFETRFQNVTESEYREETQVMHGKIMQRAGKLLEEGVSQEEAEAIISKYSLELMAEMIGCSIPTATRMLEAHEAKQA